MSESLWGCTVGKEAVHIVGDQGISVMEIEEITREGSSLRLRGLLMGEFPTCMYLRVGDFYRMLGLAVNTRFILFALFSPYYWAKDYRARHEGDTGRIVTKVMLLLVLVFLLYGFFAFAVAMVILGLISIINA